MSDRPTPETTKDDSQAARRRFLKVAGAGALAVPVIETLTGAELLTTAARAQTGGVQGLLNDPMTGELVDV